MKKYKAILFDLCDTLMPYRTDRMPRVEVGDTYIHSTTPLLYECFKKQDQRAISFEAFHRAFIETSAQILALQNKSEEEVLSETRFANFMDALACKRDDNWHILHYELMQCHLNRVADCLELPPTHKILLKHWCRDYPLGIVSNFDNSETVYQVLARENMMDFFKAILISAEFGFRKPGQKIFLESCNRLNQKPEEILFVGDSWEHDVVGARGVGMDVAWLNPKNIPYPDSNLKPTYHLHKLEDLHNIV